MIGHLAETPKDQEIVDYLVDQNKKIGEENRKLREEIECLKRERSTNTGRGLLLPWE
jgi:hypothetical protein